MIREVSEIFLFKSWFKNRKTIIKFPVKGKIKMINLFPKLYITVLN